MNDVVKNVLAVLGDRPLIIWGARMTGIGFLRFAKKYSLNIIGFIDSDKSLQGRKLDSFSISSPNELSALRARYHGLLVIVAVSVKEDEIVGLLQKGGLSKDDYLNYKDICGNFFTIDISGACNLKCPACANSLNSGNYSKGLMSINDFKAITDKILKEADFVSHFCLYNWGEPLLHPDLSFFIDYAHQNGVATAVSTNLSVNSLDRLYKLVKASPDILKISLSGYYPETYNQTHTGGDIELVKANLSKLKKYIDELKAEFFVEVNYHLYKHNTGNDLKKMRALCQELGFLLSTTYANFTPVERIIDYCQGKTAKDTREFLKLLLISLDKGLEIARPYRHLPCRFLANQVNINWDRSVSLCCVSYGKQSSILTPDFLRSSLEEITQLKENRDLCKICMGYGIHQYFQSVNQAEWKKEAERYVKL